MQERKMYRQSRRRHHRKKKQRRAKKENTVFVEKEYKILGAEKKLLCKLIKPKIIRFQNRCRKKGWLTPRARHLLESHKNYIETIKKILPIEKVWLEYGKFDISKLENPEIKGEEYQRGIPKLFSMYQQQLQFS